MPYVPQDVDMFTAVFAGALAGMGASNRIPFQTELADYDGLASLAGSFAEAFDTLWGPDGASELDLELARQLSEVVWQDRSPVPSAELLNPDTYSNEVTALRAMILAARAWYADQGIPEPSPPVAPGADGAVVFSDGEGGFTDSPDTGIGLIAAHTMKNQGKTDNGQTWSIEVGETLSADSTSDLVELNSGTLGALALQNLMITIDSNLNASSGSGDNYLVKSYRSFYWAANGGTPTVIELYDQETTNRPDTGTPPVCNIELNDDSSGIRVRANTQVGWDCNWYGNVMVTIAVAQAIP